MPARWAHQWRFVRACTYYVRVVIQHSHQIQTAAVQEEIKRAFRRAALRWHPDKQVAGEGVGGWETAARASVRMCAGLAELQAGSLLVNCLNHCNGSRFPSPINTSRGCPTSCCWHRKWPTKQGGVRHGSASSRSRPLMRRCGTPSGGGHMTEGRPWTCDGLSVKLSSCCHPALSVQRSHD